MYKIRLLRLYWKMIKRYYLVYWVESSNVQFFTYLIKNYLRNPLAFRCSYINFNHLLTYDKIKGELCSQ